MTIERIYEGEPAVFFAHIRAPETLGIIELHELLRSYREKPIESIADFQSNLAIARLPSPIRRLAWWYVTHARGYRKATWLGTFDVSIYSSLGAESLHPLSPWTTTLNYGVIQENGDVMVRVIYDHRVMDGATVARALARLDRILTHDLLSELLALEVRDSIYLPTKFRTTKLKSS